MSEKKDMTYEQAFSRLEEITAAMTSATVPLDELMKLYEEGMELSKHCERLLKSYTARLEKVSKQSMIPDAASDDGPEGDTTK